MKHVIIGAGAAGIAAAETIRRLRSNDEIVIISADDAVHSRCMLHNFISGERDEKGISHISDEFFVKNNIRWVSGKAVEGIDTANKLVRITGGAEPYDKLLIATGAESICLPHAQSLNAENIFGLRHLRDAKAIREYAKQAKNIIIIGAGLVGMDAAYALSQIGKKPVIIDRAEQILALNLDPYAANMYMQKFEKAGCSFVLGREINQVNENAGKVDSITLNFGQKLPCDMLVMAIGSSPSIGFLAGSDIACNGGITVDKYLATNINDIYAAGDVTGLSGIWPNAVKQGETAASNMCGQPATYDDTFAEKNTMNYFGIPSISLGKVMPGSGDTVQVRKDKDKYQKIILNGGQVVGVVLQGNIAHSGFWLQLVKNEIDISKANKSVFNLSFADFYGVKEDGEYMWVL
ncbi:MAG: FAD-dependent oxidoreductase [Defluviitaleaceae bacterium]|nr:FAD-dependent oxidoreductase [Defluviitaleaceae bacterium]